MSIYRDSSELSSEHTDEKEECETNSNPYFYCPFLNNPEAQSRQYHRPRRRRRRRPFYNPYYFMPYYFDDDYDDDDYDDYYSDYYDDYY